MQEKEPNGIIGEDDGKRTQEKVERGLGEQAPGRITKYCNWDLFLTRGGSKP